MKPLPLQVRTWGRDASYESIWQAMQRFTDKRNEDTLDELWLVEHDPAETVVVTAEGRQAFVDREGPQVRAPGHHAVHFRPTAPMADGPQPTDGLLEKGHGGHEHAACPEP